MDDLTMAREIPGVKSNSGQLPRTAIPAHELARRLCQSYHPFLATTGKVVPCGVHQNMARSLHVLLTPDGERALNVVLAARITSRETEEAPSEPVEIDEHVNADGEPIPAHVPTDDSPPPHGEGEL